MFDISELPDLDGLPAADEAALVAAIGGWARAEAAAAARRLAAIAELTARRCPGDPDRSMWAADGWDGVAAEVGAAMQVSHAKAASQMYLAKALGERLPKIGALFAAGQLNTALVAAIAWRTHLIEDPRVLTGTQDRDHGVTVGEDE